MTHRKRKQGRPAKTMPLLVSRSNVARSETISNSKPRPIQRLKPADFIKGAVKASIIDAISDGSVSEQLGELAIHLLHLESA